MNDRYRNPQHGFQRLHGATPSGGGFLGALLATVIGSVLLTLGFMFSLVIFTIVAVVGLVGFVYLWWKTRALRGQIKEQMRQQAQSKRDTEDAPGDGIVIEGEIVHEERQSPPPH